MSSAICFNSVQSKILSSGNGSLSPARWHGKFAYLSSLGMLGTTQLSFICNHITFNNGYMKSTHTRQRMTNNNNKNIR